MALTPHSTLRLRLLTVLETLGGSAKRAVILDELDSRYGTAWTTDDLRPQNTRQFETKWRNRTSFERQRLIEDGLLQARSDGVWALTDLGRESIGALDRAKAAWRDGEIARRERLWDTLSEITRAERTEPAEVRAAGIYAGARGIYVDVANTRNEFAPSGAALSFLHLGERYANELSAGGVVYHFPDSARPGRDRAEVEATGAAFALSLPVFVIMLAEDSPRHRAVRRAFVEDIDAENRTALITFLDEAEVPPPPVTSDDAPFDLLDLEPIERWARRRARPHQSRFAFDVMRRYGAACTVCGLSVSQVIEAAHLRPKSRAGSDDARNGLPLCTNHHRMFDALLWSIHPVDLSIRVQEPFTRGSLGITASDIRHLPSAPHAEALQDAWETWRGREMGVHGGNGSTP